jgi:SAM-dependent methyltransferase
LGDKNQLIFIQENSDLFNGPFLEIGSKYGEAQLRSYFSGLGEYIGVDMAEGKTVDFVIDFIEDFEVIDNALNGRRFGTIFCLSVLEHCEQPFKMAENMTRLLKPGGKICISVPFAWKYHGYPLDYWRFTHEGIKKLFPGLSFNLKGGTEVSSIDGEFRPLSQDIGRVSIRGRRHRKEGHWLRSLSADIFKILSRIGMFKWIFGYPYLLRPTNIYMIGVLKD